MKKQRKNKNTIIKKKEDKKMANIVLNARKNAIEITKSFEKKASIFNSKEYLELKAAKMDFPNYQVVVKNSSKRKLEDRITMKDIVYYVTEHSGEDSEEMKQLKELRGKSLKEAGDVFEVEETASFVTIKKWFFDTYSELSHKADNRQKRINQILAEAEAKAKAKANANANADSIAA